VGHQQGAVILEKPKGLLVVFVDRWGVLHLALVTKVHESNRSTTARPTVNLWFTTSDERQTDQYGLQKKRGLNVPHKSGSTSDGSYWMTIQETMERFPDWDIHGIEPVP